MKALVKVANLAEATAKIKKTKVDSYLQLMAERRKAKAMRPMKPIKPTFLGSAVKKLSRAFPQA